jgi:uncharacterized protein
MSKFWKPLFLSFALCAAVVTAQAQTAQDPWAAWKAKDYVTALNGFKALAEKGDAKAQEQLGQMYQNGEGIAKDEVQAAAWFRKAAGQRNAQWQSLVAAFVNGAETRVYGIEPNCD